MRTPLAAVLAASLVMGWNSPPPGFPSGQPTSPSVSINEFLADNDAVIHDEQGEYDDVLELFNPGPLAVDLSGMYLTDDLTQPKRFRIPGGLSIAPAGFVLFWADSSPGQGPNHTNFALSKSGESLALFDADERGNALIDAVTFGPQTTDLSQARCPDGGKTWIERAAPTMGATNAPCGAPPVVAELEQLPAFPGANEPVSVSVTLTGDTAITATLWYNTDTTFQPVEMDRQVGDRYRAVIPGQASGTWVRYYVEAQDDAGQSTTDPASAPGQTYSYVAGYARPPVVLNELMSNNQATLVDPNEPGEHPDWLELYNSGPTPVDLGGFSLSDDPGDPGKYRIPDGTTIAAAGFLVFYADGEPEQGPLHANFNLSANGETLGLFAAEGKVTVDAVRFPPLQADVSYGRRPSGTGDWAVEECPSPREATGPCRRLFLALIGREARAPSPPPLPLRIDCGSDSPYAAASGAVYQADRPWGSDSAYGYLGGYQQLATEWWEGNPVGGTSDGELYKSQRRAWQEYRVSRIPNGDYLLTLRFEEQEVHGPGFHVFDVSVEGRTVLAHFDVFEQVGRYYAADRRFAVTVSDGELNVVATAIAGEARLSALELIPRAPDAIAPAVPVHLTASPSYGAVLLNWDDNSEDDLAGYEVYRAQSAAGPYTRLAGATTVYLSRYEDDMTSAGVAYFYRVTAVDVRGNASGQGPVAQAAALDLADASLPMYQLKVPAANLAVLYADPLSDVEVPGVFTLAGQPSVAAVRFRGSASRTYPKKSWNVKFDYNGALAPRDELNLSATWLDDSLMRETLATGVFETAGVRPANVRPILLMLNGDYMGVYADNEQVDEAFLARTGRDPRANIYKVVDRFGELLPSEADYRGYYEKKTNKGLEHSDLIAFIELMNDSPDSEFAAAISATLDMQAFLNYYAVDVLIGNSDSARHNIYLVHDLATGKWEFIPWDLEIAFSRSPFAPIDMGTREHPWGPGGWNILRTRVLAVPTFRAYYCQRLATLLDTAFSGAAMSTRVDAAHRAIARDGSIDWRKSSWDQNEAFLAAPAAIKEFITQRIAFLRGEMPAFCAHS